MKENGTLEGVKSTTGRLQAYIRAKFTTREYRTLNVSQGQMMEYRTHGRATCTTEDWSTGHTVGPLVQCMRTGCA